MASKPPKTSVEVQAEVLDRASKPGAGIAAPDFIHSAASSALSFAQKLQKYMESPNEENQGFLQQELERPLKAGGRFVFQVLPALYKLGRSALGWAAPALLSVTGMPPGEVNTLISRLNGADGVMSTWREFVNLAEKHAEAWSKMSLPQKIAEPFRRLGYTVLNAFPAIWGTLNTVITNAVGFAGTISSSIKTLKGDLDKSLAFQVLDKTTPLGNIMGLAGVAEQVLQKFEKPEDLLKAIAGTSNAWGRFASWLATSTPIGKLLSLNTRMLWEAYGNPLMTAVTSGDKGKIKELVQDGMKKAADFASQKTGIDFTARIANITQISERVQRGDYSVLNDVVKTFVPGFDVQSGDSVRQLVSKLQDMRFTFNQAIDTLGKRGGLTEGIDFERVAIPLKALVGLGGIEGAALEAVKKTLNLSGGQNAGNALTQQFETIRATGANMVRAAESFVQGIQNPQLRQKMGYTISAGSMNEAMEALVEQGVSADFISKIHTFNLVQPSQALTALSAADLATFKEKMLAEVSKTKPAASPPHSPVA